MKESNKLTSLKLELVLQGWLEVELDAMNHRTGRATSSCDSGRAGGSRELLARRDRVHAIFSTNGRRRNTLERRRRAKREIERLGTVAMVAGGLALHSADRRSPGGGTSNSGSSDGRTAGRARRHRTRQFSLGTEGIG